MSDERESELQIAQRAARVVGLPYTDNEPADALRARVRVEWAKSLGSGAIVPAWLGSVLNEGQPVKVPQFFVTAADLAKHAPVLPLSGERAKAFEAIMQESDRKIGELLRARYSNKVPR